MYCYKLPCYFEITPNQIKITYRLRKNVTSTLKIDNEDMIFLKDTDERSEESYI